MKNTEEIYRILKDKFQDKVIELKTFSSNRTLLLILKQLPKSVYSKR